MIVRRCQAPDLYQFVHDANLLRQYDLVATKVIVALETGFRIDFRCISDLNFVAVVNLHEDAGRYRFSTNEDVHIPGSTLTVPLAPQVHAQMSDFVAEVRDGWDGFSLLSLPAYALWRLTAIHPFGDGNGRTAQAVAYYLLCLKAERLIGGERIIQSLIRERKRDYVELLRAVDSEYERSGKVVLDDLVLFLADMLEMQLHD